MSVKPPPLAEARYGSDSAGLVWAFHLTSDAPGREITSDAARAPLEHGDRLGAGDFVWLHFALGNASSERWMHENLHLPEVFYEGLHQGIASTRLEQDDDSLVGVIHDVSFEFTFDASAISTVHVCVQPGLLVSARPRPLRSIDQLRHAVKSGTLFRSPADLLARLLREQADVLAEIVRKTTVRVDEIEDRFLTARVSSRRGELGAIRRMLVRLQRLLAPEPAALFRLLSRPPHWIGEADLQDLREAAEEFSAAVGDSGALVERVKLLQEESATLVNEQTNRTLFVLTLVTVLALPINMLAGLFGMNVGGIPFAGNANGFLVVAGTAMAVTVVAAYFAIWRRRER